MVLPMSVDKTIEKAYGDHHYQQQRYGFSFELEKRGAIILNWVGSGKRILDVGCRDGVFTQQIMKNNVVVGIDIDANALQKCNKNLGIETIQHNINTLFPFSNESFDVVILGEVLEHTMFPELVLVEVARVLKTKGILAGTVPNAYRLKNRLLFLLGKKYDPDHTHLHQFSLKELKGLLCTKFVILELRIVFGRLIRFSAKLFGNTIMFFCQKP